MLRGRAPNHESTGRGGVVPIFLRITSCVLQTLISLTLYFFVFFRDLYHHTFLHQTCAKLMKNIWSCEYCPITPGKGGCSGNFLYAYHAAWIPPLSAMFSPKKKQTMIRGVAGVGGGEVEIDML